MSEADDKMRAALGMEVLPDGHPVKLAREVLATVPNPEDVANRDCVVMARLVIAQEQELVQLRAALAEASARIQAWAEQEYSGTSYFAREMADVERWRKLVTR